MLSTALESIAMQTFRDFEVVVVNDAGLCVDQVLAPLRDRMRIAHTRHEANRGLAGARNTGLRLARGKYVAYLDDDDLFYPDHLDTLVSHLERTQGAAAYSDAQRILQAQVGGRLVEVKRDLPYSRDMDDFILVDNFIPVLCMVHRGTASTRAVSPTNLHAEQGQYEQAVTHDNQVLSDYLRNVETLISLAVVSLTLGDHASALSFVTRALAVQPEHTEALALRARLGHAVLGARALTRAA
jgi:glycosyltransferase involved in cell wall biosynthesis